MHRPILLVHHFLKRIGQIAALALLLGFGLSATAGAAHAGECKIDEMRYWHSGLLGSLIIEGSTTCQTGSIGIRIYDEGGGTQEYLGIARGVISSFGFEVTAAGIDEMPKSIAFKYRISSK